MFIELEILAGHEKEETKQNVLFNTDEIKSIYQKPTEDFCRVVVNHSFVWKEGDVTEVSMDQTYATTKSYNEIRSFLASKGLIL